MSPTGPKEDLFSGKLRELERRHRETAAQVRLFENADHGQVRRELERLRREELEEELRQRRRAETGRSPAVAAMCQAQLEYLCHVRSILQTQLPACLHSEGTEPLADQAEAACLYGEYAMDAAEQAMRHALLAALQAMDLQMRCQEQTAQPSTHHEEESR